VWAQFLRVRAFYNEFEPFAAHWLRELIREGLIPEGDVDERSITDVEPADLKGYTQCHFFAGIGGWAYATRLARWPDSKPIWTGSPPCQPFSAAGKRLGTEDERHLWPVWFDLVRKCRPPTIFGEQVSAAIRYGWLDQLQADLEASNYAVGSVIIPASSVGALHKRDRIWFVAHSNNSRSQGRLPRREDQEREVEHRYARCGSAADRLADSNNLRYERSQETGWEAQWRSEHTGQYSVADSNNPGQRTVGGPIQQDQRDNPWGGCQAVQCKDGKIRLIPTEPEIFPLANGIPNRVGTLRGAGNAIVPQVAAEILKIFI
tara:strand:+ start:741 stop:1694 length:954 start_codon:yes stop_codon:yes gene_type:complete